MASARDDIYSVTCALRCAEGADTRAELVAGCAEAHLVKAAADSDVAIKLLASAYAEIAHATAEHHRWSAQRYRAAAAKVTALLHDVPDEVSGDTPN